MKVVWIAALLMVALIPVGSEHNCILIDTGHGGYPVEDGRLSEFRDYAVRKGFSVDFKEIGAVDLHEYCLVVSATPDTVFTHKECDHLREYVTQGGILFVTGAGDYENRDHSEVTNPLLEALGSEMRFNDDQLQDTINSGKSFIPLFDQWQPHPLTEDLPPISLYSPESVVGKGYTLLQGNATTKSEDTDGFIVTPAQRITVLAVERLGKGDLFAGGSWGFLSGLSFQGHTKFTEQLLWYVSRKRVTIPLYEDAFQGASIITGEQCRPEVDKRGAAILCEILHGEISLQRAVQKGVPTVVIGGPDVNPLFEEINPYLPIQMGKDHHWYITRHGQKFYGQEYGIIAVVTVEERDVLVVAGLGGTGTAGAVTVLSQIENYVLVYTYNEHGEAVLITVSGDTNLNGIQEDSEPWEILIL